MAVSIFLPELSASGDGQMVIGLLKILPALQSLCTGCKGLNPGRAQRVGDVLREKRTIKCLAMNGEGALALDPPFGPIHFAAPGEPMDIPEAMMVGRMASGLKLDHLILHRFRSGRTSHSDAACYDGVACRRFTLSHLRHGPPQHGHNTKALSDVLLQHLKPAPTTLRI